MAKIVILLGAGASKCVGAPLMYDFLDKAEELHAAGAIPRGDDSFDLVFKALYLLQRAHAKAAIDLDNLESVFGAFEMAKLLGQLEQLSPTEIQKLPSAISRVIEVTLLQTMEGTVQQGQVTLADYDGFAARLCLKTALGLWGECWQTAAGHDLHAKEHTDGATSTHGRPVGMH